MYNKCLNLRIRTKKGKKYLFCILKMARIELNECKSCNSLQFKKAAKNGFKMQNKGICKKTINKVSKTNKVTKATSIPAKVKKAVWIRDNKQCIFCGKPVDLFYANSHYIKRSHLGLGIEQNIMTNCLECHEKFEQGIYRESMKEYAKKYFMSKYSDWKEENLIYKKN